MPTKRFFNKCLISLALILVTPLVAFTQGDFWNELNGVYGGTAIGILENGDGDLIASVEYSGIFKSTDNGANWTKITAGIFDNSLYGLQIAPNGKMYAVTWNRLYESSDGGNTWTIVSTGQFVGVNFLAISANGNIHVAGSNGVFRSTNQGLNFAFMPNQSFGSAIRDLQIASNNQPIVVTHDNGIFVYNGTTWVTRNNGLDGNFDWWTNLKVHPSGDYYYATYSNLFRSIDEGQNWISLTENLPSGTGGGLIEFDPDGSIYVFTYNGNRVLKSTDSGTTWVELNSPNPLERTRAAYFASATEFYAGLYTFGMYRTEDGGFNWPQANAGLTGTSYSGFIIANNGFLLAANSSQGIYRSTNEGNNWDFVNLSRGSNNFIILPSGRILVYGEGMEFSDDNGFNWFDRNDSDGFQKIIALDEDNLFAYTWSAEFKTSSDQGATWNTVSITGLPTEFYAEREFLYSDNEGNIYILLWNPAESKRAIYKVPNGSTAASLIADLPDHFEDFQVVGNKLFALTQMWPDGTLHVSENGGTTWESKPAPLSYRLWAPSENALFYSIGSDNYLSTDAGDSFNSIGPFEGNRWPQHFRLNAANFAYAAVENSPVYRSATVVAPPDAPTNLEVLGFSHDRVSLTWQDNSNNESLYVLERSEGNNENYVLWGNFGAVNNMQSKGSLITGASPNTTHFFRIAASNAAGQSAYSNEISVTTPDFCETDIPNNRSWSAQTFFCESDLGGTVNYITTGTYWGGPAGCDGAGTISLSPTSNPGVYVMSDPSFGLWTCLGYDIPTNVRFAESCGLISYSGTDQFGGSYSLELVSNDGTTLVFDWSNTHDMGGRVELTRAGGWPLYLSDSEQVPDPEYLSNNSVSIIRQGTTNNFTISSVDQGSTNLAIGYNPAPSSNFTENCGQTLISGGAYIPNGAGTWDPVTKTLVLNWQINPVFNQSAFAESTTYVLNDTDPTPSIPNLNAYLINQNRVLLRWQSIPFATEYIIERSFNSGSGFAEVARVNYPAVEYYDEDLFATTPYYYRLRAANEWGVSDPSTERFILTIQPLFNPLENEVAQTFINTQGGTWADLNNDGLEDLIISPFQNSDGTVTIPRFFINQDIGQFEELEVPELAEEGGVYRMINVADINNDGQLDLYASRTTTAVGGQPHLVLYGRADGGFDKFVMTETAFPSALGSSSLIDFDHDGLLDVFYAHDRLGSPTLLEPNYLFKNLGDETFERVTEGNLVTDIGAHRHAAWADYDNDGYLDVFVLNLFNTAPNRLYRNNGDGTFTRVTGLIFDTDLIFTGRTCSWGDYDNDGFMDLFVGTVQGTIENVLYRNLGDGTFEKTTTQVTETGLSTYGSAWGDIDNDGDLDLILSNSNANAIYFNNGDGTFSKYESSELFNSPDVFSIGVALADMNNDGFLDMYLGKGSTTIIDLPNYVYQNTTQPSATRNWVKFKLEGFVSNKSAIGARVKISIGDEIQIREVSTNTGYGAQNSLLVHFGLGSATTIDEVEVTWPSGIIQRMQNISANQLVYIPEDNEGPVIVATSPLHEETGVLPFNVVVDFVLDEEFNLVPGTSIRIFDQQTDIEVYSELMVNAFTSDMFVSFEIPDGTLLPGTTYYVLIDEGAMEDIYGNLSLAYNWVFTTVSKPEIIGISPENGAVNVDIENLNLVITFNREVEPVDGKFIVITHGDDINIAVTSNDQAGFSTEKTYIIPTQLMAFAEYYINLEDDAFIDAQGIGAEGINGPAWTFRTRDVTPPTFFAFNPPQILNKGFGQHGIEMEIFDNDAVSSARIFYRSISQRDYTELLLTNTQDNNWEGTLLETFFDEMGLEFYFEAEDPTGNIARLPITETFKTRIAFPAGAEPQLPVNTFGETQQNYRMISIPYNVPSNDVVAILSEMNNLTPKVDWRLLTLKDDRSFSEFPTFPTLSRGVGYWFISTTARQLRIEDASAPPFSQDQLYTMNLRMGWNQIGNPYAVPIQWSKVKQFNSGVGGIAGLGNLKTYSGTFSDADQLAVMSGAYVFANDAINIQIPFPDQVTGGRLDNVNAGSRLDAIIWELPLKLNHGEIRNDLVAIGMRPDADLSFDQYDDPTLPRFLNFAEVNFPHPEHFAKRFSKDIVPTQTEYTWEFTVDTNQDGAARLSWDNSDLGSTKDLVLFDVARQRMVDMKSTSSYNFDPRNSSTFRIYFGENLAEKIKPDLVMLGHAYPNPSKGETHIPFTISNEAGDVQVVMELFNNLGVKVGTVVTGQFSPGFFEAYWESGSKELSNGMYLIKLSVAGRDFQETQYGKLILAK